MGTLPGWIRPLTLPNVEAGIPRRTSAEAILADFCRGDVDSTPTAVLARYNEISTATDEIFVVPAHAMILERLVWPLRSAKQSYCLGEFLGAIGLSGTVSEMATVFIFDLGADHWSPDQLSPELQQALQDRAYERMRQDERVRILRRGGIIDDGFAEHLTIVRQTRRQYMHILSSSYDNIQRDAARAYSSAVQVVRALVGLPLGDAGQLAIPTHLAGFLSGIIRTHPET